MIDLHTHTFLSDGDLVPTELARRAQVKGYEVIGITDHIDFSNFDSIIPSICRVCEHINRHMEIKAIPGAEITHVSPEDIAGLVSSSRDLGASLVVVHGETVVEPVAPGTNRAAIEAGVDILAHPGLLNESDARLAAEKKVSIEISGRSGHSFSNGHVAKLWYKYRFPIILNTDTHSSHNLVSDEFARKLIISAGIEEEDIRTVLGNSSFLASKLMKREKQ